MSEGYVGWKENKIKKLLELYKILKLTYPDTLLYLYQQSGTMLFISSQPIQNNLLTSKCPEL